MKNENSLLSQDGDYHADPKFPGLQRELMHLHQVSFILHNVPNYLSNSSCSNSVSFQVNEELGSMNPAFKQCSSNGNAIERVLALEIELAEALQAKKKASIQFQRYIITCSNQMHTIIC